MPRFKAYIEYGDKLAMKKCAFTGHRPQKLPFGSNESDERCVTLKHCLHDLILRLIEQRNVRHFISGMAIGTDMYAAEIILDLIANLRINAPKQRYETKPNNQHVKYMKKPGQQRQIVHRQTEPSHDAEWLSSSTITSQSDSNPDCMAAETKPSHRKLPEQSVPHWRDGCAYCP